MMRQDRRNLLDKNHLEFLHHMNVEDVIELLVVKEVFNETVIDSIIASPTERDRRKEVVKEIKKRGDVAYDAFYEALIESGQDDLAELLKPLLIGAHHYQSGVRASRVTISTASATISSPPTTRRRMEIGAVATTSRPRRETISSTCFDPSAQLLSRARSRSRSQKPLHASDRMNYQSPVRSIFNRQTPSSPNHSFGSGSLGYSSSASTRSSIGSYKYAPNSPTEPYEFNVNSMNYTDAPSIQRIYDKETMYPNFSNPRGLCLIINNEHFEQMPTRNGTKTDKENISNLFRTMGYHILGRDNLTAREILFTIQDFTRESAHRRCSSAIIVILSHGEENKIIGVDDQSVSTHDLCDLLSASKAPFLANKPKLVFIQACRGERRDTGFAVPHDAIDGIPAMLRSGRVAAYNQMSFDKGDGPIFNFMGCIRPQLQQTAWRKKPDQADILIAYATTAQFVSWRNSVKGSWFIQAICEVFSRHAVDMDIVEMLTEVNKKVACGFQTSQGTMTLKQMPEMTSRLLKKFYFWPCRNSGV
ncbi:unnamed protein product [Caenorhabditis angaria]|uniref:Caspase n=1 Tax=Caenorhabditis angaria TaxID=860376 RepID=A0A9P1N388_9PELO|nr:unnamed protein product [Caenorhabditis angaria]